MRRMNESWARLNLPFLPYSDKYSFPTSQRERAKYTDHINQRDLINPEFEKWANDRGVGITRIERFSSNPNYRMYIHTDNSDFINNTVKIIWCFCPTKDHSMIWYDLKDPEWFDTIGNNDSGETMRFEDWNAIEKTRVTIGDQPILANVGNPHNIENGQSYRHVVCAWFHKLATPGVDLQWKDAVYLFNDYIIKE